MTISPYTPWRPLQNLLLAALPEVLVQSMHPHLEMVQLQVGEVLQAGSGDDAHVYFPLTSIISMQVLQRDGSASEVATVGNEGVVSAVSMAPFIDFPSQAVVRGAGQAFRLRSTLFSVVFGSRGAGVSALLRFTQTLLLQCAQTAVCNRRHSIEQQLCRLLLSSRDRVLSVPLHLTHDMSATLLGVRREGITRVSGTLQRAGLIHYSHGKITLIDRYGLEQRACECYGVIRLALAKLIAGDKGDASQPGRRYHVGDGEVPAYITT